jgi:hypothetical protein
VNKNKATMRAKQCEWGEKNQGWRDAREDGIKEGGGGDGRKSGWA